MRGKRITVGLLLSAMLPASLIMSGCGTEKSADGVTEIELGDMLKKMPNQLSGGQQQRVSIARALVGNPSLILADEPTGALDSRTSREVLNFLKDLNQEGNTIVIITHDNSIALEAKRVIRIHDGKVVFDGSAEGYRKEMQG